MQLSIWGNGFQFPISTFSKFQQFLHQICNFSTSLTSSLNICSVLSIETCKHRKRGRKKSYASPKRQLNKLHKNNFTPKQQLIAYSTKVTTSNRNLRTFSHKSQWAAVIWNNQSKISTRKKARIFTLDYRLANSLSTWTCITTNLIMPKENLKVGLLCNILSLFLGEKKKLS